MTPNEIIVKFKPNIAEVLIDNLNQLLGASIIRSNSLLGIDVLEIPSDVLVQDAMNQYKASGLMKYAEPNFIRTTSNVPDDPLFGNQWNLSNKNDSDIDAPEAWDVQSDCSNIAIAVMDTGINYHQRDLGDNYLKVEGYEFVNRDNDSLDDNGHGTALAGIIGAEGNNGKGVAGICWHIQLVSLKVFDENGIGTTSNIIDAAQYAIEIKNEHNIDLKAINMSFGEGDLAEQKLTRSRRYRLQTSG